MTRTTRQGLFRAGAAYLARSGVEDADFDARQLLLHLFGIDHTRFLTEGGMAVAEADKAAYDALLARRAAGEPLQYILGQWDFYGETFAVGPGVLIPRQETERLTELCIEAVRTQGAGCVFDLCAGTGCIGLTIARACPQTQVYLLELYDEALSYLRQNEAAFALPNAHIIQADVFNGPPEALPAPDVIVANPPYVKADEIAGLPRELGFEPETALDGGADGTVFYRAIAEQWLPLLPKNGFAAVECGEGQPETVAALFGRTLTCACVSDQFGVTRFVVGSKL